MIEGAEAGDVPNLAVGLLEVIGIQLVLVEPATALSAKIGVVTQAMDGHHPIFSIDADAPFDVNVVSLLPVAGFRIPSLRAERTRARSQDRQR
jgi:hypothetical protein